MYRIVAFSVLLLAGCGTSAPAPVMPAVVVTAASKPAAETPFRCTAQEFEGLTANLGMPFEPKEKADDALVFRSTKSRKSDADPVEHFWLSRQSGKVRSIVYWRMSGPDESAQASRDTIVTFAKLAKAIFNEEDAAKTSGWYVVALRSALAFETEREQVAKLLKQPVGETDFVTTAGGIRVSYRRLTMPGAVNHVVNFDIDHKSPDWPEGPLLN